jgi:enterochelin esterase-like enzyme
MNGSRIDTIEIQSSALEKTMAMKVYVPANGNEGMPVLYLMHGRSGDENMMNVLGMQSAADKMIASGAIRPMVVV